MEIWAQKSPSACRRKVSMPTGAFIGGNPFWKVYAHKHIVPWSRFPGGDTVPHPGAVVKPLSPKDVR